MGSIVKSIGKTIKKIGKGLKKVIKKIGPALLVAAAVYAGVAFYGASISAGTAAAGGSTLGTTNFMPGLNSMGPSVMKFFSPAGTGAGTGAGTAVTQAAGLGASGNVSLAQASAAGVGPGMTGLASDVGASVIKSYSSAVAGGMTSGDALVYMTKMNMFATGAKMAAGFFDKSEQEQREHEEKLLSQKYAYGRPIGEEQEAYLAANPNWISEHAAMQGQDLYSSPNLMQSQAMANLPTQETVPSPYVQQQTIGQPTFGRQTAGNYGTTAPQAFSGTTQGLIKKGTQSFVDPRKQRGFV